MADVPDFSMTSLALRFLSNAECRRILRCNSGDQYCEWDNAGLTFVYCPHGIEYLTDTGASTMGVGIMRAGAMGGDVRDIHGGWLYLTEMHALREWREIQEVAKAYKSR